jgi:hypothetical protein
MKKLFLLIGLSISLNTYAASDLITLDAYKVCPNLKAYTYGYNISPFQFDDCIELLEGNKFQKEAASICLNLPYYSHGYYVPGSDVNSCFQHIRNKTFSENRIKYCQNLKILRLRNGYDTTASDVYNCLK